MRVGPHMTKTEVQAATSDDLQRACAILQRTRAALAKYQDYRQAEADSRLASHLSSTTTPPPLPATGISAMC